MDKIARILFLYSKLIKGEGVNKTVFCIENECSARAFDRDIEDIRLYLSESYSVSELIYDRSRNVYYLSGAERTNLESVEYLFVEQILRDMAVLRKDEFEILTAHLLSNTEKTKSFDWLKQEEHNGYKSPSHNKALLKIHGDLVTVIQYKKCIRLKYFISDGEEVEQNVIPCTIKADIGYLYLIGYRENEMEEYPAFFRLDKIYSFHIIRNQTDVEQERVKSYMEDYANGMITKQGNTAKFEKCKK